MNQILKLLTISFYSIVLFSTVSLAQMVPGPLMACGDIGKMSSFPQKYEETEFMVLQLDKNNINAYHILYRNKNTGTWTLTAYNIPNAPPDIICILQGGLSSYILPDIDAINEMLDKQQEGLDEPLKPNTNEKQT
jgi:hypothetical protein